MASPDYKSPNYKSPEIILVDDDADGVCCDGGHPTLGHPVVWYSFAKSDQAECKYCDRVFIKKRAAVELPA